MEYWIIGNMLKEGLDVFVPLVDDDAIDAVIRRPDGSFTTVQIKARSKECIPGDAALFAAIPHELRENYWFVFYSERMDTTWIMTSKEFIRGVPVRTRPVRIKENGQSGSMEEERQDHRDDHRALQATVREVYRPRFPKTAGGVSRC